MSVTSILKIREVQKWFRDSVPKPRIKLNGDLLAPPTSKSYSLIGTAFDYLFRFRIERLNATNTVARSWVAESGMDNLLDNIIFSSRLPAEQLERICNKAESLLKYSKDAYSKYLECGKITQKILKAAIYLAQLDILFRPAIIADDFGNAKKEHLQDLKKLISIAPIEKFKADKICAVNPIFGIASHYVGGADADLVIDDKLIDIKTTINLKLDRTAYNQIWSYYLLSRIGNISGLRKKHKIRHLGIYFSRHAELFVFCIDDILNTADSKKCVKEFEKIIFKFNLPE